MKKLLWTVFILTLAVIVVLITAEQYYVSVALLVGLVVLGHREIWFLLKYRKLPPVDERVRENTSKAVRNGFIYFAAASALLILPFTEFITDNVKTVHVLAGLFLSAGLVYLLSYLYYDRAEPKMDERLLKRMKTFLIISGLSIAVFIVGVFMHSALGALFGIEEPVFFTIAVIISPAALAAGIIGSLVLLIMGLARRSS